MKRQVMVPTKSGRYVRRAVRICPDYVDLATADRRLAVRGLVNVELERFLKRGGQVRKRRNMIGGEPGAGLPRYSIMGFEHVVRIDLGDRSRGAYMEQPGRKPVPVKWRKAYRAALAQGGSVQVKRA